MIIPEDQTTMPFCLVLELDELSVLSPGPLAERVRRIEEGEWTAPPCLVRMAGGGSVRYPPSIRIGNVLPR